MTPAQLSEAVLCAARRSAPSAARTAPAGAGLRRPPRGDAHWATGLALRWAGPTGRPAEELAGRLCAELRNVPGIRDATVAPPGFVNIWLAAPARADAELLAEIAALPLPAPLPDDPARDVLAWAAATGATAHRSRLLAQRAENPLFRVRYAHARTRALLHGGAALDLTPEPSGAHRLTHPAERAVLGQLAEWSAPRPADAGRGRPLARRVLALADAFLDTTVESGAAVLPSGPEKPGAVHRARLALAQAVGTVLADGLYRLGVGAPEHA